MEPESSLRYSQEPATCPYPEPYILIYTTTLSHHLKIHFNIILQSYAKVYGVISSFQVSSPKQCTNFSSPKHTTCPAHLIFLDLITRIIFGEEYRS